MAHPKRRSHGGDCSAPVLFLDVDGVLNVSVATATDAVGAFSLLHASLLDRVARIVRRSRARVVLSSSWRHDRQRLALLERAWRIAQLPLLDGETPTLATTTALAAEYAGVAVARQRVLEIQQWLRENGGPSACRWAAVDDLDLAVAADAADQPNYVQTDPQCGLSVANMEKLVTLLTGGKEGDDESTDLLPVSVEAQQLQLAVDLIVVESNAPATAATVAIVDCADFAIAACLDSAQQPLRGWLRSQEAEFSLERIATIQLRKEKGTTLDPNSLTVQMESAETSSEGFALTFVHDITTGDGAYANKVINLLLEASQQRVLAQWDGNDAVTRQLRNTGFSAHEVAQLATSSRLVLHLLDVLPILEPSMSPQRLRLAVQICHLFPGPLERKSRRLLSEYIARGEITSRAALDAVKLMWTTQDRVLEELDELLSASML